MTSEVSRRILLGAAATLPFARAGLAADVPKPSSPLTVTVVDVAGNLALTQPAFENYAKEKPGYIGRFAFTKAPAPELPAKIKAQQNANRVDIDLVLTGTDALAAGIEQNLWMPIFPAHASALPDLKSVLLEPAARIRVWPTTRP